LTLLEKLEMDIIKALNWRYATKKFDPERKINESDLRTISEVLRLTPSSYGLQPLKFIFIEDPQLRKVLLPHSFNQSQVTDASHLLLICSYRDIRNEDIDAHIRNTVNIRNLDPDRMTGYGDFMKRTIGELSESSKLTWNVKQAYIVLGQLMLACAQMGIDTTPMEGFDADKFDEILGLNEKNLHATLLCPMGYRSTDDPAQYNPKVRKSEEDLFETL
jgi:nitroreductase/dihydropteridine reductase